MHLPVLPLSTTLPMTATNVSPAQHTTFNRCYCPSITCASLEPHRWKVTIEFTLKSLTSKRLCQELLPASRQRHAHQANEIGTGACTRKNAIRPSGTFCGQTQTLRCTNPDTSLHLLTYFHYIIELYIYKRPRNSMHHRTVWATFAIDEAIGKRNQTCDVPW